MKQVLIYLIFIIQPYTVQDIALFKNLKFGMSKLEAKNELKENSSNYNKINLGDNRAWKTDLKNIHFKNDSLKHIYFYLKGTLLTGLGYDKTIESINILSESFKQIGYKEFYKDNKWNEPFEFDSKQYLNINLENFLTKHKLGLILYSNDKSKIAHIFINKSINSSYNVGLIITNYNEFMNIYNKRTDNNILDIDTGF